MKTENNPSKIRKKTRILTLTTSIQQHTEVLEEAVRQEKNPYWHKRHYMFLAADDIFLYVEIPKN